MRYGDDATGQRLFLGIVDLSRVLDILDALFDPGKLGLVGINGRIALGIVLDPARDLIELFSKAGKLGLLGFGRGMADREDTGETTIMDGRCSKAGIHPFPPLDF